MIGCSEFMNVYQDHFIANNIMAHEIDVINRHVIAKITANDNAVIKSDRHAEVIELKEIRL